MMRPRLIRGTVARMGERVAATWTWLRERPTIADALLALAMGGIGYVSLAPTLQLVPGFREPDLLAVALVALQTLPLTFRRWRPLEVYAVVGVSTVVYAQLGYPSGVVGLGVLVALYTVASMVPLRHAIIAGGVYVIGMLMSVLAIYDIVDATPEALIRDIVVNLLLVVLAWTVGVTIRTRRAYIAELEARTALLEREREEHARLAIALERGRIARELHDVVAHAVSVMVVQAGAAERVVERDPERARQALDTIATTGRESLGEMRRLLGAMREPSDEDGRLPQPGLAHLGDLVERVRRAGLPVELSVQGEVRSLPPTVDLSAYRLVQEALTNTLKHAGEARARVLVRYAADALELRITDTGTGRTAPALADSGHGLIGMRERIALFDGSLEAGPRSEGGYAVEARIPLTGPA